MRFKLIVGACAIALSQFAVSMDAASQTPADMQGIRQELDALRAAQASSQIELQEIKALLQRLSVPAPVAAVPFAGTELSLEGAQIKGAAHAKVVVVEYSDFQCPFCASYAASSYPQIIRDYVDTGRVRYAFMHFPIESLHPMAFKKHVAAACAADEGRFWEMHDRLFANLNTADANALAGHASAVGLNAATFRACLESDRHAAGIRQAMRTASVLGVTGTPTFLIGVIGPDEKFRSVTGVVGAKPYSVLKESIDGVLMTTVARNGASPPAEPAVGPTGWRAVNAVK